MIDDIRDVFPNADADGTAEFVNMGTEKEPWVVLRHKENYKKFQEWCATQPTLLDCMLTIATQKHD